MNARIQTILLAPLRAVAMLWLIFCSFGGPVLVLDTPTHSPWQLIVACAGGVTLLIAISATMVEGGTEYLSRVLYGGARRNDATRLQAQNVHQQVGKPLGESDAQTLQMDRDEMTTTQKLQVATDALKQIKFCCVPVPGMHMRKIAESALAILATPSTEQPTATVDQLEAAAKAVYEKLPTDRAGGPKTFPWQPGGNSHMQDEARKYARAALKAIAQAAPAGQAVVALREALEKIAASSPSGDYYHTNKNNIHIARSAISIFKVTERAATQPAGEALWWAHTQKVVKELAAFCFGGPDLDTRISCGSAYLALINSLTAKDGLQIAAPISEDAGEDADVDRYARELATAIWQKHYASEVPHWEVLPDLRGALSQIDNMTEGMCRPPASPSGSTEQPAATAAKDSGVVPTVGAVAWAVLAGSGYIRYWSYERSKVKDFAARLPNCEVVPIIGVTTSAPDLSAQQPAVASADGPEFGTLCRNLADATSNTDYSFCRSKLVDAINTWGAQQREAGRREANENGLSSVLKANNELAVAEKERDDLRAQLEKVIEFSRECNELSSKLMAERNAARAQLARPACMEELGVILDGIDKEQCEGKSGWWETSAGAKFGAGKLAKLESLFSRLARPADLAGLTRYGYAAATNDSFCMLHSGQYVLLADVQALLAAKPAPGFDSHEGAMMAEVREDGVFLTGRFKSGGLVPPDGC